MAEHDTAASGVGGHKLTYEDYVSLPDDGRRYEILDGELVVTPSPRTRHQIVSANLGLVLQLHVRAHDLGIVLHAPIDVILHDSTIVVPDIVFVSKARRPVITDRAIEAPPDLVIEILWPSTEGRGAKLQLYARFGVPHYWIVDADEREVTLHELDGGGYRLVQTAKGDETVTPSLFPGLTIGLRDIWP